MHEKPEVRKNSPSQRDWRRVLPGFFISAAALVGLFLFIDFNDFRTALLLADYRLILVVLGTMLVWLGIRSILWRTLLRGQVQIGLVFVTLSEGYLLNNLLPFRLGEVGRAYLLSRKSRLSFWEVMASIAIERILDLACALSLLLISLPYIVNVAWPRQAAVGAGLLVGLGLGGLYFFARARQHLVALYSRFSAGRPGLIRRTESAFRTLLEGLSVLTDWRRFLAAVGWMFLNWLVGILQYYLLVRAFYPQGELLWAIFVLGVGALGIAAPSSPGAVGVFEAAVVGALSVFGAEPEPALALALTAHILQVLLTGLIGSVSLAREGESLWGLYRRIRQITPTPPDSYSSENGTVKVNYPSEDQ